LQIGKEDDKKESEYQKYIYHASKGYQYYGKSGQDIKIKLFWKSAVWKFDIWDSSPVVFKCSRGIQKIATCPCD
jgi:hypothetical protein